MISFLSFIVCLLSSMKEYREIVVKLFARGERLSDIFQWLKPQGVRRRRKLPLVFIEKNVKINAAYYKTLVADKVMAPALRELYEKDHYVFQQDGATAHTANIVKNF